MKKFVIAAIAAVALAFAVFMFMGDADAGHGPPCMPRHDPVEKLVKQKRKIAVELCTAMARSGAYAGLNDNEFSDFCIKVASHLGDSAYDHIDE